MKRSHWGAMLLCILIACSYAFGQVATTSLRGTVTDPAGAVVHGATVTLLDKSVNKTYTATTDSSGYYQFPQIPPTRYLITISAAGFADQTKTAELLVNQPATVNVKLTVQASNITVDVSASAQTLNTTDASEGNSIGNEMIQSIPSDGRDPISLLALQPGVLFLGEGGGTSATGNQEQTDSRQGAVSGSRSDQGNVTLDGLDDNNQINGYAFTGVLRSTLDSTQEFRVTTSDGSSDEGRSSGAQIALVTKSGTNNFHGSAYEYYRPTNTVSNNWFLKNSQLSAGLPNVPAKYLRNVFGSALGGPIKKDRLFFFGNYEGLRQAIDDVASATVPTASFQAGTLQYLDSSQNQHSISTSQIAALDSNCTSSMFDGATVCPWGPGVNPNVLSYYGKVPVATGSASGDGINSGSLFFPVKVPTTQNTSILKLDYNMTQKQQVFVRGNYQKDTYAGDANLPGQPPATTKVYNTKGLAVGHTWNPTPNIVNDLRYGYVRQSYGLSGIGSGQYVDFRFLTQPEAQTRNTTNAVPVHNVVDTLTITKGNHTISVGVNWRLVQDVTSTDAASFNVASTNPYWLGGNPPDPSTLGAGIAPVGGGFQNSYAIAYASILGTVPSLTNNYNYGVTSPTAATLLGTGASIPRHFLANESEAFVQDSWRVLPNLTVTAGLRYTLLQTPYETKGQEIAPTVDTDAWYKQRGIAASTGTIYEPNLEFAPAGKANNAPGYWPENKNDFAPRFSVAWSPDSKTSIRAGAGVYFDHYGEALTQAFSTEGSFGLSTSLTNPAGVYSYTSSSRYSAAPRFTGEHNLPNLPIQAAAQTATFPYAPPTGAFLITWGVDNKLKTPYSEAYNLSFQRELPGGFLFEEAYVGRFGRHLLQQLDLAEPVNMNDPQGGGDYFTAGAQLSKLVDIHQGAFYSNYYGYGQNASSPVTVPTIQYFEDVFPQMANLDFQGESATEGVYNNEWAPYRYSYGETTSLADIDFFCVYGGYCANGTSKFWQSQFSSLYAWASIGTSSYNALQASLRHPTAHGLSFDLSYTLSKSMDLNSGTERGNEFSADNSGGSAIQNTWNPQLNKAVSDFDTRHLVNADMVYDIPVGRGKSFLSAANPLVDGLIGGWTFAGLYRWTSGLPFSLYEPGWSTDWQLEGYAVQTGYVKTHKHYVAGQEQVFANPSAISNGYQTNNGPVRLPYPGEAGMRNAFRGDGYFDIDSTLSKIWTVSNYGRLKFDWEVFNVTNSNRFDTASISAGVASGTLGAYGNTLPSASNFRRMQFGLRYDF